MKRLTLRLLVACTILCNAGERETPPYKNPDLAVDERVTDLLLRMTMEEKIGQLCCPLGWEMYVKDASSGSTEITTSPVFRQMMNQAPQGALWCVLRADPWTQKTLETGLNPLESAEAIRALQCYAVDSTRLGIPLFFMEESPHGHMAIGSTVFPTSIALASSWDKDLMHDIGDAIGREIDALGANVAYGPILDVARDARWSRMEETFGEDPVLTSTLGGAFIQGLQSNGVSSTVKHFAAYGIPESGHNGASAQIGLRTLATDYLPPFEKAVKSGVDFIMTAYNDIDGIPCTSNDYLLTEVLRNQWGFQGVVISDLHSIGAICNQRAGEDYCHAAAQSLLAGLDMNLGGVYFSNFLPEALEKGLVEQADIDRAVERVLRMKFEKGLFENPYGGATNFRNDVIRNERSLQLALKAATEGTVLLKNNGILPLDSRKIRKIAVIGPNADNMYNQLGDYTAPQHPDAIVTILEGIRALTDDMTEIEYVKGCAIRDTSLNEISQAVAAARSADVAILVVGGSSARDFSTEYLATGAATAGDDDDFYIPDMDSGEGYDRNSLNLLGLQPQLLQNLLSTDTPMIVIYIQGRPLDMTVASEQADALLTCWYPGEQGGMAMANILFGVDNPSGRLPVSIPRTVGQLPLYYSQAKKDRYVEGPGDALYPFGYGLGYTSFEYSDISLDGSHLSFYIENTGQHPGTDVAQMYVSCHGAPVAMPPLSLRRFERIALQPGEKRRVTFTLDEADFQFFNRNMQREIGPYRFTISVGPSSANLPLSVSFTPSSLAEQ